MNHGPAGRRCLRRTTAWQVDRKCFALNSLHIHARLRADKTGTPTRNINQTWSVRVVRHRRDLESVNQSFVRFVTATFRSKAKWALHFGRSDTLPRRPAPEKAQGQEVLEG